MASSRTFIEPDKLAETMRFEETGMEDRLGELAVSNGLATREQIRQCLDEQARLVRQGRALRLGDLLLQHGLITPEQLNDLLIEQSNAPTRSRFENFELLSKLGEGGMGAVYKARRLSDERLVALKVLSKALACDDVFVQRFKREAEISRSLQHPNLIQCLEFGECSNRQYMALEYVDGRDLSKGLLLKGKFPEAQAISIVLNAARGIAYAHERGLIHRDIKPSNLMLTTDGNVMVMDFGLARTRQSNEVLTMTGVVMGTPHYMSPEQVDGTVALDERSDVYSLGATLFHMLTGRPPFMSKNFMGVLTAHLTKPFPDPREFVPELDAETAQLVIRMCKQNRDERIPDMKTVVHELGMLLGLPSALESDRGIHEIKLWDFEATAEPQTQNPESVRLAKALGCPRCHTSYHGDPRLVGEGQRLFCRHCSLVYVSVLSGASSSTTGVAVLPPAQFGPAAAISSIHVAPEMLPAPGASSTNLQVQAIPKRLPVLNATNIRPFAMRLRMQALNFIDRLTAKIRSESGPWILKGLVLLSIFCLTYWLGTLLIGEALDRFFTKQQ